MKKHIALALAFVFALGLVGCSNLGAGQNAMNTTDDIFQKTYTLGDVVEWDGVSISFVDGFMSNGDGYFVPSEGNVFVICEFEVSNETSETFMAGSILSFSAFVDDYEVDFSLLATASANMDTFGGDVASGRKMRGIIGYEVPSDWKLFEVEYTPDIWGDKTLSFAVSNG